MNNPAIQNDFSYYRRTKNRKKMEDQDVMINGDLELPDDVANRMSLFYANPTPMLNTLTNATTKFTTQVCGCGCGWVLGCVRPMSLSGWVQSWYIGFFKPQSLQSPVVPLENTTDVLSTMAAVCRVMTENQ